MHNSRELNSHGNVEGEESEVAVDVVNHLMRDVHMGGGCPRMHVDTIPANPM